MQGRLLPPVAGRFQAFPGARWPCEFALAAEAGVEAIELIYESFERDANPLAGDAAARELERVREETGIAAESVCADRFMETPVVGADEGTRRTLAEELVQLLERCAPLGIRRVVLPFVDASRMPDAAARDEVVDWMGVVTLAARRMGVELHLETDLGPRDFADLLDRLDEEVVRVNYDSGNSASLGFDHREEFAAYGARIGSFHVKDRVRGGGTVPPGEGDADLPGVFAALRGAGYDGDVVLQVARGVDGDEPAWIARHATLVRRLWEEAA